MVLQLQLLLLLPLRLVHQGQQQPRVSAVPCTAARPAAAREPHCLPAAPPHNSAASTILECQHPAGSAHHRCCLWRLLVVLLAQRQWQHCLCAALLQAESVLLLLLQMHLLPPLKEVRG